MEYDQLRACHERRPFQPFEITTVDGRVYTIDQPEYLAQSPTRRYVLLETDAGRIVTLGADQIAAVGPVKAPFA
jgi:hypothetical protein